MNNGVLSSLSTKVYPFIAKNSGTTAINIERNIRNSIKCAKEYCENNGMFDNLFFKVDHVSNKTLIGYLVDQLSNSAMEMNQVV